MQVGNRRQLKPTLIAGQPSWPVKSDAVAAAVTVTGGHLGPVRFRLGSRVVEPLSVAPWAEEKLDPATPNILRVLRGDFLCLPFGGNTRAYRGEQHGIHGEVANRRWHLVAAHPGHLHLRLKTRVRPGRVDKHIFLRDDAPVVYQRHVITGMAGRMSFGHHAMLKFRSPGLISTSSFVHGQVDPDWFEKPEHRGYQALRPGATFRSLGAVPLCMGGTADLTRYPARQGFEDLVQIIADPATPLAWNTVVFPAERFVWYAVRDPRILTGTTFWISNGGRHYPPWNGRHLAVLGIEDGTSYLAYGLAESAAPNPLTKRGYITSVHLDPCRPLVVNYIFGIAAIPRGFGAVQTLTPTGGGIEMRDAAGHRVRAVVDLTFLQGGE
jgi:hypothetical protein